MSLQNFSLGFIALVFGFYILYIGKSLFIPLVISILIWYVIISLTGSYERIMFGKIKMPRWTALILSLATFVFVAWMFVGFVNGNVQEVIEAAPAYQDKFQQIIYQIAAQFHLEGRLTINEILKYINFSKIATIAAGIVTTFAGYMSMVAIYVIFLLLEYRTFDDKITALIPNERNREEARALVGVIAKDTNTYLKIKTFVSVLTAVLCYIVMMVMDIQFAGFWAVLVFLLNYIPNIGSLVAVILPVLFSLVQYDLGYAFILMLSLVAIQMSIGNFLEPRLMGKSLNLSPLVIIISLVLWGSIWGIVGMFLCVPIMVILNIILSKFPTTRPIAILLSSKGDIIKKHPQTF